MISKLDLFFVKVILPKILCGGKSIEASDESFCICRKGEFGKMISCDSPDCQFVWYHYSCLNLNLDFEPDEWFCPVCEAKRAHLF